MRNPISFRAAACSRVSSSPVGWSRPALEMSCRLRAEGRRRPRRLREEDAAGSARRTGAQGGRGGGVYPDTEPDDNAGFVSIFDGKSLAGWDGDPLFWRAENGEIVGETTPEKVVKTNNFLIWRGGTVKIRAEGRVPDERDQQRNPVSEHRASEHRQVGAQRLSGRHGLHGRLRRQRARRARGRRAHG